MKYRFELRKDKMTTNGFIPIRLVINGDGKTIKRNIDARCFMDDWEAKSMTIVEKNSTDEILKIYKKSNANIQSIKIKVEEIIKYFEYYKLPFDCEIFTKRFDGDINPDNDFFKIFDEFIEVSKLTKTNSTVIKLKSVKTFFENFSNDTKTKIRFDSIDLNFQEKFMKYCFDEKKILNNYYGKLISNLKAFMNWAMKKKYHSNLDFKSLKRYDDEIEVIYLNYDELMNLYKFDFKNSALERSRDFFCFLCFTGQRYSDVMSLDSSNIVDDYIVYTMVKVKSVGHKVFLIDQAKKILEKYKNTIYDPIPKISSQKLNKNIQLCCEIVGLTYDIKLTRYVGGKRIDNVFRKCDIITSHVGRKTFITNSLIFGINERVVMETTNHTDYKSFKRYVEIPKSFQKKELAKWRRE